MLWSRKSATPAAGTKLVGLDLTASRARAVVAGGGRVKVIPLQPPAEDLSMLVRLDGRHPQVGREALSIVRSKPHSVASAALPLLGQPHEWRGPRLTLTPETATSAGFDAIRSVLASEAESISLTLPAYLSAAQVKATLTLALKAKLPVRTSAVAALAVVAHRASKVLSPTPTFAADTDRPDWVVPLRHPTAGPGAVVVIDADDHALTAAVVQVSASEVRLIGGGSWPRSASRRWTDRLIDAVADRCVRVCRRDPRDSAVAEQAIFDQLPAALAAAVAGQPTTVTVRADRWYQDLTFGPEELAAFCASVARPAADGIRDLIGSSGLAGPPRAVWLTTAAGMLPGLSAAIHANMPEQTAVTVLSADSIPAAAAALAARELPAGHWDLAIPVEKVAASVKAGG